MSKKTKEHAKDPHSWFEHGHSLLLAADSLWEGALHRMRAPASQRRVLSLGVARGYMTLLGASIECAIKGLAVALGCFSESNGRIKFTGVRGSESHLLPEMARSLGIVLTDGERRLLERATEYLSWAGRYPIAKRIGRSSNAMKNRLLSFSTQDQMITTRFIERLQKRAAEKQNAT